jgi:hypothetical protein
MVKHCETCECNDQGSLKLLDRRIDRLLGEAFADTAGLPPDVLARFNPNSPRYCMGFTGLKPSSSNNSLAGQFLAALFPVPYKEWNRTKHETARFFVVNTVGPIQLGMHPRSDHPYPGGVLPVAREYRMGDCFDISDTLHAEDMEMMNSWDDHTLKLYLVRHLNPLRDIVLVAFSGEPVAHV